MNKTTLLSVLLIGCAVLILAFVFLKDDRPEPKSGAGLTGPLVKDFDPKAVKSVSIKHGTTEVELKKENGKWIMPKQKGRAALESKVDSLLNGVKDATVVEKRNGSLDNFNLSPAKRTEVVFERDAGKTSLTLGKSLEYSKSFVLSDDGKQVLVVDKNLPQSAYVREEKDTYILEPKEFYDLTLLSDTPEDAIAILITKYGEKEEKFEYHKVIPGKGPIAPKQEVKPEDKPVWEQTAPEKTPLDESKMSSLLSTVLKLSTKSYADDVAEKDQGFDKPMAKIAVTLKDGTVREITFGKVDKPKEEAIAKVEGKKDVYVLNWFVFDRVTNTADLKKKEEEKKDETKPPTGDAKPPVPSPTVPAPVVPAPPQPKVEVPKPPEPPKPAPILPEKKEEPKLPPPPAQPAPKASEKPAEAPKSAEKK